MGNSIMAPYNGLSLFPDFITPPCILLSGFSFPQAYIWSFALRNRETKTFLCTFKLWLISPEWSPQEHSTYLSSSKLTHFSGLDGWASSTLNASSISCSFQSPSTPLTDRQKMKLGNRWPLDCKSLWMPCPEFRGRRDSLIAFDHAL